MEYLQIKKLFEYEPESGVLKYSHSWPDDKKGKEIKTNSVWIDGVKQPVLTVIWVLMTRQMPMSKPQIVNNNKRKRWDNIVMPTSVEPEINMEMQRFLFTGFNQKHMEHLSL